MILKKSHQIERHQNGVLAYHCTWAEIAPLWRAKYDKYLVDSNGKYLIRVGWCRKYYDNSQLAWQLKYNNLGEPIKGSFQAFRKDATPIYY